MSPESLVHVDFRKWPDRRHWQYDMYRLGEDEHGIWLWAPEGTRLQRGHEPPTRAPGLFVKLVPRDRWWSVIWNTPDGEYDVYVDINTPPHWIGNTVTMIDLDLDVVRRTGTSEVAIMDEDEFAGHAIEYGYPESVIGSARATAARMSVALQRLAEPFARTGPVWMERALELSRAQQPG